MILTQNEKNVLGHVVENPQEWADNVGKMFGVEKGKEAMLAKVSKYQESYDSSLLKGNYRDRNGRDADEEQAKLDKWAATLSDAKIKRKAEISERVTAFFIAHVDPHYLKKSRHAARGKTSVTIPASVVAFEDALTANQDAADTAIDALTTVLAVKNYTLTVPTLP